MAAHRTEKWLLRAGVDPARLVGYRVEAIDGALGRIDRASALVDDGSVVIRTGPWVLGRRVALPAGAIRRVDREERVVEIGRTRSEIRRAPALEDVSGGHPGS